MNSQSEMFFPLVLGKPKRAPQEVIDSFTCYRDAVVWTWENRAKSSGNEKLDQSAFVYWTGMHAPHMSRCVNPRTKAPMEMSPDYIPKLEAVTGWAAVTQYECKTREINPIEWVVEDRARAA